MSSAACNVLLCIFAVTLMFSSQSTEGVNNCNNKLGMESRRIPDESITASSEKSTDHAPSFARIDGSKAWCSAPEDESPYIEILLDEQKLITAITTQGSYSDLNWARKYEVKYSEKGKWKPYKEELTGNGNSRALFINELDPAIRTQKIRIYPKEPFSVMLGATDPVPSCLRLELHGCSAPGCILQGSAVLIKKDGGYRKGYIVGILYGWLEVLQSGESATTIMKTADVILDEEPNVHELATGTVVLGEDINSPGITREGKIEQIADSFCTIKTNDETWKSNLI